MNLHSSRKNDRRAETSGTGRLLPALMGALIFAAPVAVQAQDGAEGRTKVIFDTDMVELFDDGTAMMLLAQAPNVELLGVTVVAGNTPMPAGVAAGVRQLEAMGSSVPIYEGSRYGIRTWRGDRTRPEILGAELQISPITGWGGYMRAAAGNEIDADPMANWVDVYRFKYGEDPSYSGVYGLGNPDAAGNQDAVDFLVRTVNDNPGEVTIVAVGPLTNIARAILKDPTFSSKVPQIVYMGGAFYVPGNSSASAEFNWWADPDAAKISVRAQWGDTGSESFATYGNQIISGLEANWNTGGMPEDLYREMVDNTYPGIQELWLAREERLKANGRTTFGPTNVWDLFAAAYVIDPSIVLAWNNRPRPEDGAPQPISGVYVDVNSEMGLDYGRSLAFTDNDHPGAEARSGPVGTQKAAIQNYIDEEKFWKEIVVPLSTDPAKTR
ncbi:MAG: nucleoside hydrolase [Tropicimonas sp.]|uniref:nucleoside hydrolase n=1 Tax=Tropicimonas sp. TaxID=2067044 RepID=UPI003A862187